MSSYAQPSGLRSSRKWLLNTLLATASVSAVAAIAPHANAQEAAGSSDAPMIEELVVTAEKREQSLQDVPCPSSEVLGQWGFGFSGGLGSSGVDI